MFNRLMMLAAFAAMALLGLFVWHVLNRPITTFTINGDLTSLEREKISRLLSARGVDGVLDVQLSAVQEALATLSWAHSVAVRREWPNKLILSVRKLQPVARLAGGGYLSADGDLMQLPDSHPDLPQFDILLSTPAEAMEVFRLLDQIASREGLAIRELHEDGQGEWQAVFTNGLTIRLGSEQLNERMHRVLYAYRTALHSELKEEHRDIEYIDARYLSGVAVMYREPEGPTLTASIQAPPLTEVY